MLERHALLFILCLLRYSSKYGIFDLPRRPPAYLYRLLSPSEKEAKERLREAIDALMAGDDSAEMEQTLAKWDKYVTNHPDHIKEQEEEEQSWERENAARNAEALRLMRTFVPPDIFHAGLEGLRGRGLPPALAKRVFARKVETR